MRKLAIHEILDEANKLPASEIPAYLRSQQSQTLQLILQHNFDPTVTYKLPSGIPPYKAMVLPKGTSENDLYSETRRLAYLWHNPPQGLTKLKLEGLFIGMLESLHPGEATVMVAVKDKELQNTWTAITESIVRETFPGLLPATVVQDPVVEPKPKPKRAPRKKKDSASPKANGKPKTPQQ